jgi:uncharacterized RDD family membrane protein YckC
MATGMNQASYPSFGVRLLAFILDLIALSVIGNIVFRLTALQPVWIPQQILPSFDSWSAIIAVAILWLYLVGLTLRYGATLGKMAFGLEVVSQDGSKLDWSTVFIREVVGKFISVITCGLGFAWVAWDKEKQGFHDKIARTLVVYKSR